MKPKTITKRGWAVLLDLNNREYMDIAYLSGYPRIYIQNTKPIVKHENINLPVVRITISYTLPLKGKKKV